MNDSDFDSDDAIAAVLRSARGGLGPTTRERVATLDRLSATLVGTPSLGSSSAGHGGAGHGGTNGGGTLSGAGLGGATLGKSIATVFLVGLAVGGGIGFGGGYWARSEQIRVGSVGEPGVSESSALETSTATERGGAASEANAGLSPSAMLDEGAAVKVPASERAALAPHVVAETSSTTAVSPANGDRIERDSRPLSSRRAATSSPRWEQRGPVKANRAELASLASDDEVAFVRRAQKALRNGDAAWALALMRTLDEQLPRGALLTERNVTRVLALCQLGRTDEARAVAERTLRSDRGSGVYAGRLAASCVRSDDSTSE